MSRSILLQYLVGFSLFVASGSQNGFAATVPTNWWSNQTSASNVIEALSPASFPERVRLGNATSGFIEGSVSLPQSGRWEISLIAAADEDPGRSPDDYLELYIDSILVGRVFNTPASEQFPFTPEITGNSFDYRFEFTSSNATDHLHLQVLAGSATLVPEPSSAALLTCSLMAISGYVYRRRLSQC